MRTRAGSDSLIASRTGVPLRVERSISVGSIGQSVLRLAFRFHPGTLLALMTAR